MGRYFVELSYDGSDFVGWQVQLNGIAVQQVLDEKLSTIFREKVETVGCGRTDAGVHASYFVAHFDAADSNQQTLDRAVYQLNRILPSSISIFSISPVSPNAHARFDAVERTYHYFLTQRKNPFNSRYAYHFKQPLDENKMNLAAELLLSVSDFTSFAKLHSDNKTNICKVYTAQWNRENNGALVFTITADRYLRNMVRAIVGTMIDVGRGKISPEQLIEVAEEKSRGAAGTSAPAHGLFLADIKYPSSVFTRTTYSAL